MQPPIRYKLLFSQGSPVGGQEVTPIIMYEDKEKAVAVAQAISRAIGLMIDVIKVEPVHQTVVVANLNG